MVKIEGGRIGFQARKEIDDEDEEINVYKRKFKCGRCGYVFSVDTAKFSKIVCPWCGREL